MFLFSTIIYSFSSSTFISFTYYPIFWLEPNPDKNWATLSAISLFLKEEHLSVLVAAYFSKLFSFFYRAAVWVTTYTICSYSVKSKKGIIYPSSPSPIASSLCFNSSFSCLNLSSYSSLSYPTTLPSSWVTLTLMFISTSGYSSSISLSTFIRSSLFVFLNYSFYSLSLTTSASAVMISSAILSAASLSSISALFFLSCSAARASMTCDSFMLPSSSSSPFCWGVSWGLTLISSLSISSSALTSSSILIGSSCYFSPVPPFFFSSTSFLSSSQPPV